MKIHLLYFASFREARGQDSETRELPDGTRVEELWKKLCAEEPRFAAFPRMPPAAVNLEYVGGERPLADGDEVAFLPPVAGG